MNENLSKIMELLGTGDESRVRLGYELLKGEKFPDALRMPCIPTTPGWRNYKYTIIAWLHDFRDSEPLYKPPIILVIYCPKEHIGRMQYYLQQYMFDAYLLLQEPTTEGARIESYPPLTDSSIISMEHEIFNLSIRFNQFKSYSMVTCETSETSRKRNSTSSWTFKKVIRNWLKQLRTLLAGIPRRVLK